jgi:hypothetical protein
MTKTYKLTQKFFDNRPGVVNFDHYKPLTLYLNSVMANGSLLLKARETDVMVLAQPSEVEETHP